MLFNSYELIFGFLPLTLLIFFLAARFGRPTAAIACLVAASFFFYYWGGSVYLGLFGLSIFGNYLLGTVLTEELSLPFDRRWSLTAGIAFNLLILGYFKYSSLAIGSVNYLFGMNFLLPSIALPLGISFYTFGQISYLVDTYCGKTREDSFLNYCLFVSFFPKLIAGPIVYHRELMPQFAQAETFRFNPENLAVGMAIFSIGLSKKVIFADTLSNYSSAVFAVAREGQALSLSAAWLGALTFALQLYFDFSGYTDMAIGSARLFGIKLPLNFNSPYKATKISQLWTAWHRTLTRFFRDYLYFPLARFSRRFAVFRSDRGQKVAGYGITLTIMLGIGLWHGAGWNYVLWGGLNGIYLVVYQLWRELRRRSGDDLTQQTPWSRVRGWLCTFIAWTVAVVLARATNLSQAVTIWRGMLGLSYFSSQEVSLNAIPGFDPTAAILWIIVSLAIVLLTPNTQEWLELYRPALDHFVLNLPKTAYQRFWERWRWQPTPIWAIITAILTIIGILFIGREKTFIYFQF
jgi:D-alanyl-lipoteichoic acid acyltransferase DltB (MBOAT superfamily)